jgi:CRP/FNR family transcriptional regulator, cyclic AMP receptor protein
MACDPALLRDVKLFSLLDDSERAALAQLVDVVEFRTEDVVFTSGDPGETLYVVAGGEVELFVKDYAGQKIVLTLARKGDHFGELALLDSGSRTATAVALAPTQLIEVGRDDILSLVQRQPHAALDLLGAMAAMTRRADEVLKNRVSRNVNEEIAENLGPLERFADLMAAFSGSIWFLVVHAVWFAVWIGVNIIPAIPRFDPFPFGLLTMIVSLEAIALSCLVLISQNRQVEKDRVRSDVEYDVNVKAELGVAQLHEKTDRIYEMTAARLRAIEKKLEIGPPAKNGS